MVDYRFSNPSVWEQPDSLAQNPWVWPDPIPMSSPLRPMLKLAELETTRDFFGGNPTHTMLAYQTAAEELARWLSVVHRKNVAALTDAVANGDDFYDVYHRLERDHR
ncbi:hypothetical protein [Spirosoma telluris]|uniref:hypothetical protein n=1 Tax=Spirosoma telluris TaxID=2183553 RepID=UPI002FC306AF